VAALEQLEELMIKGLRVVKKPFETYLIVREDDGDRELTAAECEQLERVANAAPELPSWDDDDYKKARDCALGIINQQRHVGEKVALDVFDNAFQHAVGMLALTARASKSKKLSSDG
jgi:hypothetical protein